MTRKHFYVVVIIVAMFALGVFVGYNNNGGALDSLVVDSAFAQSGGVSVTRWEYKVVGYDGSGFLDEREKEFNQIGSEGWELVTVYGTAHYFKRPLRVVSRR